MVSRLCVVDANCNFPFGIVVAGCSGSLNATGVLLFFGPVVFSYA